MDDEDEVVDGVGDFAVGDLGEALQAAVDHAGLLIRVLKYEADVKYYSNLKVIVP